MSIGSVPDLRAPGWAMRSEHGGGVATLYYFDDTIRVEHMCTRLRDGETLLIAPALTYRDQPGGHQVLRLSPLTITPSILCDDCGLHGFITDGEWRAC